MKKPQYWVAELDRYGMPVDLLDGGYTNPVNCDHAYRILKHLGKLDKKKTYGRIKVVEVEEYHYRKQGEKL